MIYITVAMLQVIVFSAIPFLWWLFTSRNKEDFFSWIGLKKIQMKDKKRYWSTFFSIIALSFFSIWLLYFVIKLPMSSNIASSEFYNKGISAIVHILIWAFIQTGLSEEIFFRGFLNKRLIHKFGFNTGNLIQSVCFGLIHGIFLFTLVGGVDALIIVLLTGLSAWLSGWINEKESGGSILSSWILHGIGNTLSGVVSLLGFI